MALAMTVGEFGGALWLVVHDGHFFALYLAVTYMIRETNGGKQYHHLVQSAVAKVRTIRQTQQSTPTVPYLACVRSNPFERK